jgi:serine palmitoyltransferase
MDLHEAQDAVLRYADVASTQFQRVPGSSILVRYIRSSYQNDPARSAVELIIFLFAVVYLLSPSYSTRKPNKIILTKDVCVAF